MVYQDAGKSTLAEKLVEVLGNADWHNADKIRETFNDWDFSRRQRTTIETNERLCRKSVAKGNYGIADFVCPTNELREKNVPEYVIWMNTIEEGRFEDTNKMFEKPIDGSTFINVITHYSRRMVDRRKVEEWARVIAVDIKDLEFPTKATCYTNVRKISTMA